MISAAEYEAKSGIMEIILRPDVLVRIHGIPHDLTREEADRIAAVIQALAGQHKP